MAFCKNCGTQIPDIAKFCPKCGMATPLATQQQTAETVQPPAPPIQPLQQPQQQVQKPQQPQQQVQQPVQYTQPQQPAQPKKPVDFTWFNNHFMILFVIVGVLTFVLNELSAAYLAMSPGFAIALAVFAIIFAVGFCAIGVLRFVSSLKESKEERKAHSTRNIICLALGIIAFVFVLMSAIVVFSTASDLIDASNALSNLGSMFK